MMSGFRIVIRLAWRNLWRNIRRTLIMLTAIVIGVWAMIFMTALMRGMVDDMLRDGISVLPGHVQIHHPEFRADPTVNNLVEPPDGALLSVLQSQQVLDWAPRVRVPAVISSERNSRGVTLVGIDPEHEAALSFVADDLGDGRFLESPDDRGLVVGRKLLERLETELGRRVVVMSTDEHNEVVDRGFRIVGVFDANLEAYEEGFVFAGIEVVQTMLGIGDRVSEIAVLGADYREVGPVLDAVAGAAGPGVEVLPWTGIDTYLGTMLEVMDGFVYLWIVIIFMALSFGLVNTLVMAVFERIREIGLMLALGVTPRNILLQVVAEAILLLSIGLGAGNLLAWASVMPLEGGIDISIVAEGMEWFGAASVLSPALYAKDVVAANLIVIGLGFLSSLLPAWRASRLDPVRAISKT